MLEKFKIDQPYAYKTMASTINQNKISHAYLIETNGYSKSLDFAKEFVKSLFCKNNIDNECKCNICEKIDNNVFSEFKIVSPDGQWIKKDQIEELQREFSSKSVESDKKIYLITDASKLNKATSNSILKFLEEPESNIIAILMVDSRYQLLETIVSRCQIIALRDDENSETGKKENLARILYSSSNEMESFLTDEEINKKYNAVVAFINKLETDGLDMLLYTTKYWHAFIKTREEMELALNIMLYFYKDLMNYQLEEETYYFELDEFSTKLWKTIELNKISKKMQIVLKNKEKIKYNVNSNLFIDKLIIEIGGLNQ